MEDVWCRASGSQGEWPTSPCFPAHVKGGRHVSGFCRPFPQRQHHRRGLQRLIIGLEWAWGAPRLFPTWFRKRLPEDITSSRSYWVYHSTFSGVETEGWGACAYSEDAMKNETLVNESVIFCPLFNVKICDILYLKCCISYECFTAAFHVHIQQSAGFGKWEAVGEWSCHVCVTALQQSQQDITRFQS